MVSKDVIEPVLKPQCVDHVSHMKKGSARKLGHHFLHHQCPEKYPIIRWVNCKDMASKSCQAVRDGTLEIVPKEFEPVWFRWLENIRDWCISRQLWWGHRIPAYYVHLEGDDSCGTPGMPSEDMNRWVVARTEEEALAKSQAKYPNRTIKLIQDEDVLDTW